MNQKMIIGIGVFLVIVVLVQSVFIYRVSNQVELLSSNSGSTSQSTVPDSSKPMITPGMPPFSLDDDNWNPFEEMQRMQNEMNKIFGDMRSQLHLNPGFDNLGKSFSFSPNVDIKEEKDRIVVRADIPGSDESNINVTVKDNRLTISATTKKSKDDQGGSSLFRSERFIGQFERSVTLPAPVLTDKMKTDYKDGVLTVVIPKA